MARTKGNRAEPRQRTAAKPVPKRPGLPTVDDVKSDSRGIGRKIVTWSVGLLVVGGIIALAVGLANEVDPADTLPAVSVSIVSGDPLPGFSDPTADTALGLTAPEVTSVDFEGEPTGIINDGTPKLILFLAHWCPHCQAEVPALQAWIDENGVPEGIDFVSVATSINEARPNFPPNAWLEREGWTQRVVMDDDISTIAGFFGLETFPYYVMVDASGTVVQRIAGVQDPATVGVFMEALAVLTSN